MIEDYSIADQEIISEEIHQPSPASVDSERAILGAILLDNNALSGVGSLHVEDFYLDSHRRIFSRMRDMDPPVDIVTLSQELHRRKEVEAVGGIAYLASLTEGLPRRISVESYVRIVKDKAVLRALVALGDQIRVKGYDQSDSGAEVASWGISALSAIVENGNVKDAVTDANEMAKSAKDRLLDNPTQDEAISTGFGPLDDFTKGGIRLGELWVVGAAPSRGKTTLARQIVKHCVWRDIPCYVHSGEMTKESWFDVTACLLEGLAPWKIREPRLMSLTDKDRLREGLKNLGKMPLFLSDTGGIHIDQLVWNALRAKQKNKIKLVVVDYAQIVNANGRDERQKISAVAHRLRQFAKDENVAVILLSQSPRPEGRGINAKPTMFSLKESGSLEEAAHVVVLPYRPIDTDTGKFSGDDELIIGKSRWGAIGSIPVSLNGQYLRFDEREA